MDLKARLLQSCFHEHTVGRINDITKNKETSFLTHASEKNLNYEAVLKYNVYLCLFCYY